MEAVKVGGSSHNNLNKFLESLWDISTSDSTRETTLTTLLFTLVMAKTRGGIVKHSITKPSKNKKRKDEPVSRLKP
ncbi:hypothetical protein H5410_038902 [Solanum commersonii]|uniref:Uncharacterized protein n=1 Tax=Solanum commersonii TaxID=4109 RepID=A0A9J5YF70_SOLCO|nr:hypothetical protein H5410_038902 [Solanum commersonii]